MPINLFFYRLEAHDASYYSNSHAKLPLFFVRKAYVLSHHYNSYAYTRNYINHTAHDLPFLYNSTATYNHSQTNSAYTLPQNFIRMPAYSFISKHFCSREILFAEHKQSQIKSIDTIHQLRCHYYIVLFCQKQQPLHPGYNKECHRFLYGILTHLSGLF